MVTQAHTHTLSLSLSLTHTHTRTNKFEQQPQIALSSRLTVQPAGGTETKAGGFDSIMLL
ncbi:predicted protein [Plenodomus lingam JN3]|uniref:Uncharacterized protein n=1 Tax=Leptosphaeria maculans (strain JN3 / isolate v23.1.3 / race Av1-4-5-6-7-8) TaxID=985895 RepID=E4ZGD5_LEPMJ|nr:predicted protein [Plenodomus lingam JN3]CBX90355.1 predicted protein [Plenodomus lingam JN3]